MRKDGLVSHIALHEAAHAVVAAYLRLSGSKYVTIEPTANSGGHFSLSMSGARISVYRAGDKPGTYRADHGDRYRYCNGAMVGTCGSHGRSIPRGFAPGGATIEAAQSERSRFYKEREEVYGESALPR